MSILPPEIWLYVFALVSHIPGAFDTTCPNAITAFTRDTYGICVHNRFRSMMNTKLALSRVCRCWNALAREVLFHYIIIRNGQQALAIAAALKDHAGSDPGRLATRLEIALEGVHIWTEEHTCAVLRIFESCPNLVCFSTAFSTADPSVFCSTRLIEALRFHKALKRVELKTDAEILEALAEALPSVHVLWLWPCRRLFTSVVQRTLTFPNLHTLVSEYEGGTYMGGLFLPALRAVRLPHKLPILQIHLENMEFVDAQHLTIILPTLHRWVNLKTMVVGYSDLVVERYPWSGYIANTSVERIIIDGTRDPNMPLWRRTADNSARTKAMLEALSTNLFHLITMVLGLRSLRFLLPYQNESYPILAVEESPVWEAWLERCHSLKISLEVSQGTKECSADEYQVFSPHSLHKKLFKRPHSVDQPQENQE